ncbi:RELT-like protein 1 [Bombina bombina]|uniref:RELT-like protein 1 n=1 Tax=Bombina bombina TaxID=8345 RepID=UPI00235A5D17|nr:RELT-like protein 1 [Bombina bombina]
MSPVYSASELLSWPQQVPRRAVRSAENYPMASSGPDIIKAEANTSHPEYVAFILVPVFFVMGLLGVLICHVLKKKGYRCTTEAEPVEEEKVEKIEMRESVGDTNNDTVGQIVSYIMKNQANADILKAMVADNSVVADTSVFDPESPTTPNSPLTPTSPNSPLSPTSPNSPMSPDSPSTPTSPNATPSKHSCRGHHLHTVGGVAEKNACTRCSNKRWHLIKSPQKHTRKPRQGAVTVLSVGRFRVTKVETKSKERKRLMSGGTEHPNGEVTAMSDIRHRSGTESEDPATVQT